MRVATNFSGRIGGWSARHRKTAIWGWLAFVVLAVVLSAVIPARELTAADQMMGDERVAQEIIDAAGFDEPATEMVLVQRDAATPAAEARAAAVAVAQRLEGLPDVAEVSPADGPEAEGMMSRDGLSQLVVFELAGDPDDAVDRIRPVMEAVRDVAAANPGVLVEQFGNASAEVALDETIGKDGQTAEMLSIPITLSVLLLTFGALVAALLPLGFALTAFLAALGLMGLASQVFPVQSSATTIMLLIGMAVGVDYSLFYLKREREERAKGATPEEALLTAASTSGHSVLISGLTVVVAMAGLFMTGHPVFTGMGVATILVVLTSVAGSLTFLPAMLSWLGARVELGRIPVLGRRAQQGGNSRMWSVVLGAVLRRPALAAAAATLGLVALALPALQIEVRNEGLADLPEDLPIIQTYHRVNDAFPGGPDPARVVVKAADVTAPEVQAQLTALRTAALATGRLHDPIEVKVNDDRTVAVVSVPMSGDGENAESVAALETLRDEVVPATVGTLDGATVKVTGSTAAAESFKELIRERTPYVFAFVLLLAFALLLLSFRSLVVAATAIVLNLLSVAAAYGSLVLVFQHGWGKELIGLDRTGPIINWLPLFLFVILFGLSMDYHVFILSRIREGVDRGLPTPRAVRDGIISSAGVVTSAAMIMVFVFLTFVTLDMTSMKQIGLGLAVAVLLDATVIRAILLPAVMRLLGERNWYLPRWLRWLPASRAHEPASAFELVK